MSEREYVGGRNSTDTPETLSSGGHQSDLVTPRDPRTEPDMGFTNTDDASKAVLLERASELDIPGRSSMTKDELATAIGDAEAAAAGLQVDPAAS